MFVLKLDIFIVFVYIYYCDVGNYLVFDWYYERVFVLLGGLMCVYLGNVNICYVRISWSCRGVWFVMY